MLDSTIRYPGILPGMVGIRNIFDLPRKIWYTKFMNIDERNKKFEEEFGWHIDPLTGDAWRYVESSN